ncbi:MAG: hypothetical protein L3J78_01460 [Thermoplasmata archaeon]|nr:hypothetical protein [Thermoplasmata archaeon]
MSHPRRVAAVAAVLFATLLLPIGFPVSAAGPPPVPLYGDATAGWGNTSTSIRSPGPNLTFVLGEPVTLALHGADANKHNWFIDYNANGAPDPGQGEPVSSDFTGAGPMLFTFTPDRVGKFTYKCAYHQATMFGTAYVVARTNVTLYGDQINGWGFNTTTIHSPGPTLIFLANTNVTFTLIAADSAPMHNFFIDYNGDRAPSPGEPKAMDFSAGNPVSVTFNLSTAGNFSYYCEYHSGRMWGTVLILGAVVLRGGFNVALIPGIMAVTLGGVLVFAAVYHARAVRAAKRSK